MLCQIYFIFKSPTIPDVDPHPICNSQVLICPRRAWGICTKLKPQAETSYPLSFVYICPHVGPPPPCLRSVIHYITQDEAVVTFESIPFFLPQICWDLGCAPPSKMSYFILYMPRCAQSLRLTPINHYNSQVTICTDAAQRIIPPLLARVTILQSTVVCPFHLPRCHFTYIRCSCTCRWCTWGCGWWSIIMDRDHNLHHCRSLVLLVEQKYRFLIIHSNFYAETKSMWTQPC